MCLCVCMCICVSADTVLKEIYSFLQLKVVETIYNYKCLEIKVYPISEMNYLEVQIQNPDLAS